MVFIHASCSDPVLPGSFGASRRIGMTCLCVLSLLCGSFGVETSPAVHKRALAEKLDSIDLEKQLRKRKGESLEDLEKVSSLLKDSIAEIKRNLPSGSEPSESEPDSSSSNIAAAKKSSPWIGAIQKFMPSTLFDWLVVCIGFVAVVSGIVLIIGIFGFFSKNLKKKKKTSSPPKPLHEIFPRSYAADAYDRIPKVPGGGTEEKDETVTSIRKRIEEDEGVLATVEDGPPPDPQARIARDPAEIKRQVIRASEQGLDISEISKRFHLSSDEVSLILRIARRPDGKAK